MPVANSVMKGRLVVLKVLDLEASNLCSRVVHPGSAVHCAEGTRTLDEQVSKTIVLFIILECYSFSPYIAGPTNSEEGSDVYIFIPPQVLG